VRVTLLALPAAGCFGPLFGPSALPPDQELLTYVEQIRTAQVELLAVDDFVACGSEPEARAVVSSSPRAWEGAPCWTRIGWAPDGPIRGGYWVEVSADSQDFTAHGIAPGDLRAVATRAEPARLIQDVR
jgi:hypothetical protein